MFFWKFQNFCEKKFLLLSFSTSMYGPVRDRWYLNCTKTDQKISIMNTLNDNLTYNTSIPPKRFLALFNWKVPTFWFYMAILHVIHKSINYGSKYANLTQKLFKTSLKAFSTTVFLFYEKKKNKIQKFYNRPNLGHVWQKTRFFACFVFDLPLFSAGNRQTRKKIMLATRIN